MTLFFSTNAVPCRIFEKMFDYVEPFDGRLGLELFPEFDKLEYEGLVEKNFERIRRYPVSFHGPYYDSDFSCRKGTEEYQRSIGYLEKTLALGKCLHSAYVVYHHNNRAFAPGERDGILANARENFPEIRALCEKYGVTLAVENAGVKFHKNMLLDEGEFIEECRRLDVRVLIDIGHAHANGWNLPHVMEALSSRIISYHLHNNDGVRDLHQRIFNGTLDFPEFLKTCERLTPEADLVLEYCPQAAEDIRGVREDAQDILEFLKK